VRVLLTGASGFIGAQISAELVRAGAEVRAFCRSAPPAGAFVSDWVDGDVTDLEAVRRAVAGCEAVVHTAARYSYRRTESALMEAVNVGGTQNVVEAVVRAGVGRLLVTSSSATCGPVQGRPATELDGPPKWELQVPYKRTKFAAERLALAAAGDGLEVVCVNPTTVVGPGDDQPTPSGKMVGDLVAGRIRAYLRGAGINVVAVQDVARGHVLALERGRSGERYILGGEDLWLRDAFALGLESVGRRPPRLAVPWRMAYGAALVANATTRAVGREPRLLVLDEVRLARLPLFFSSEKAHSELGYHPGPAADALKAAARWFAAALPTPAGRPAWRSVRPSDHQAPFTRGG
jgi:dihydroflavonol-4-reductase